jgi:hypothetical protein
MQQSSSTSSGFFDVRYSIRGGATIGFAKKGEEPTRREKNEEIKWKEKKVRGGKKKDKKKIGGKEINCLFFINCILEIILVKLLLGNWI